MNLSKDIAGVKNLIDFLKENGYDNVMEVPNRGICGTMRMLFTVGMFYGLDEFSYKGRYCFETLQDAKDALEVWTGEGDPDGDWIKHKGKTEYLNPNKTF